MDVFLADDHAILNYVLQPQWNPRLVLSTRLPLDIRTCQTNAKASYRISVAMVVTALNYLATKTKSVLSLENVPRCEKGGLSGLLQPSSL